MLNNGCADDVKISVDVTYSEVDSGIGIKFSCAGESYNPLENISDELNEEHLGATILKSMTKNYSYEYSSGVNKINFTLP